MLRVCSRCLGRSARDGLMWNTDLKPHASSEFSMVVVQTNSSLEDQTQVFTSPSATLVAVYDGHGGPEASRFANSNLLPLLHTPSFDHLRRRSFKLRFFGFTTGNFVPILWNILL